jgi:hypothetical protein
MKNVRACGCRHRGVTTLPWPCMPLLHWESTVHSAPRSLALLPGTPRSTLPFCHRPTTSTKRCTYLHTVTANPRACVDH